VEGGRAKEQRVDEHSTLRLLQGKQVLKERLNGYTTIIGRRLEKQRLVKDSMRKERRRGQQMVGHPVLKGRRLKQQRLD
jgi:hypothetical protein